VDVSNGLIHHAGGELVHIVTSNDHKVTHILVKFDNPDVAAKAKQSSQYRHQYSDAVPLIKHEAVLLAKGRAVTLSVTMEPDDVIVLLTAPTGAAAFIISGMTLHSALLLGSGKYSGFQPLNHDRWNTLRSKPSRLTLLIVDGIIWLEQTCCWKSIRDYNR